MSDSILDPTSGAAPHEWDRELPESVVGHVPLQRQEWVAGVVLVSVRVQRVLVHGSWSLTGKR
jgi:hypothetical protein